jgi:hypothetical protein
MRRIQKITLNAVLLMMVAMQQSMALAQERVPMAVEVKPLTTLGIAALNAVPGMEGSYGLGFGLEIPVAKKLALFGDFDIMRIRADGDFNDDGEDEDEDDESADKEANLREGNYASGVVGARYHFKAGSSWYAQAGLGYTLQQSEWSYERADTKADAKVDANKDTVDVTESRLNAVVGGGYRWIWGEHFTLRLGGTLAATIAQNAHYKPGRNNSDDEAVDKVKDASGGRMLLIPGGEVAIGWAF